MNTTILPSRRVVALVIIPIVTICIIWSGGLLRNQYLEYQKTKQQNLQNTLQGAVVNYNRKDTDGDLLRDWEEFLHNTDINDPDTDGDGLNDFAESRDPIRDPLVADSELGVSPTTPADQPIDTSYTTDESLTATSKFAFDAVSLYLQLQDTDKSQQTRDILIEQTVSDFDIREQKTSNITVSDIVTVADSYQAREQYRQVLLSAFKQLENPGDHELVLFANYVDSRDETYGTQLASRAQQYQTFVNTIQSTSIPQPIANTHVDLVNYISVLSQNVRAMSDLQTDPLGALAALGDYSIDGETLDTILQDFALYFSTE